MPRNHYHQNKVLVNQEKFDDDDYYDNNGIYKVRRKGGKVAKKSQKNSKTITNTRSQSIGSVESLDDDINDNNITIDNSFMEMFRISSPPTLTGDYLEKGRSMINKGKNNCQAAIRTKARGHARNRKYSDISLSSEDGSEGDSFNQSVFLGDSLIDNTSPVKKNKSSFIMNENTSLSNTTSHFTQDVNNSDGNCISPSSQSIITTENLNMHTLSLNDKKKQVFGGDRININNNSHHSTINISSSSTSSLKTPLKTSHKKNAGSVMDLSPFGSVKIGQSYKKPLKILTTPKLNLNSPFSQSLGSLSDQSPIALQNQHFFPTSPGSPSVNIVKESSSHSIDSPFTIVVTKTDETKKIDAVNAITSAIFEALFGNLQTKNTPERIKRWDDADSESESEDEGESNLFDPFSKLNKNKIKIANVDEQSFKSIVKSTDLLTSSGIDFAFRQAYSLPSPNNQMGHNDKVGESSMLSRYITSTLVRGTAQALCHEDHRFQSSRVSILTAIYRNSRAEDDARLGTLVPLRLLIANSLCETTHDRLYRCRESVEMSRRLELDTNEIASRGLIGLDIEDAFHTLAESSTLFAVVTNDTTVTTPAVPLEERSRVTIKDHDFAVMEVVIFVTLTELTEVQQRVKDSLCNRNNYPSTRIIDSTVRKGRLGEEDFYNSYISDWNQLSTSKQPSQEGLFADQITAKVLQRLIRIISNVLRCYGCSLGQSGETVEQPMLLNKVIESLTNVFRCACCLGDRISIISSLTRQFLSLLMRSWPRKQNHVQETAFVKITELTLQFASLSNIYKDQSPLLTPIIVVSPLSPVDVVERAVRQLMIGVNSTHFKVACQSITSLQQPIILSKYFIPQYNGTEKFIETRKELMVETLLVQLRVNRSHWHPNVALLSSDFMDILLDSI